MFQGLCRLPVEIGQRFHIIVCATRLRYIDIFRRLLFRDSLAVQVRSDRGIGRAQNLQSFESVLVVLETLDVGIRYPFSEIEGADNHSTNKHTNCERYVVRMFLEDTAAIHIDGTHGKCSKNTKFWAVKCPFSENKTWMLGMPFLNAVGRCVMASGAHPFLTGIGCQGLSNASYY